MSSKVTVKRIQRNMLEFFTGFASGAHLWDAGWLGWLAGWAGLLGWLAGWLANCLLAGGLAGWLPGWLLAGWLFGWLAGLLDLLLSAR